MANPELSRRAARLFNDYKVPLDKGFDWAVEIETAKSVSDLSEELQKFLSKPYFINPRPKSLEKHLAGQHDQSEHGNRAGSSVSNKLTRSVLDRVRAKGGLSVRMRDGSEPVKGYMVSRKGMSKIVADKDFFDANKGKKILADYLKEHKTELGTGKDYLGIWHNKKNHKVYLDVSMNIMSRRNAIELGKKNNQISIWDVVKLDEIETGGTGND